MSKKVKDSILYRKRGYVENEEILTYKHLSFTKLNKMLCAGESYKRTIAIRLLSENYYEEYEDVLSTLYIQILAKEKSLYTRLEAQRSLERSSTITVEKLCKYVNRIPNNQHIELPKKITRKKTYPIARDIPTRILAQIGTPALNYIKQTIDEGIEEVVREILDAFGYILYHNNEMTNYDEYIMSLFNKYVDNDVIIWKLIRVSSSINSQKLKSYLLNYKSTNDIHEQEIKRTIEFMDRYTSRKYK